MRKLLLYLIFISLAAFGFSYSVKIIGLDDPHIIEALKGSSNLFILQDKPPRSVNALRFRIENSLPEMVKTLKAFGYFDASVTYDLEDEEKEVKVFIFCDLKDRYLLSSYDICINPCEEKVCKNFDLDISKLGIKLNAPIDSRKMSSAKDKIIHYLTDKGYPLAKIEHYEIIADGIAKKISVKVCVQTGPFCYFGPISITGLKDIYPKYIYHKVVWKEKDPYSTEKIKETQTRLSETNLFSSVMINPAQELNAENLLPIKIEVVESKHQNVTVGASYATVDGLGGSLGYTHNNLRHMGEIINLEGEFAQRAYTGSATYKKPDFLRFDQELMLQAAALREKIRAYHSITYSGIVRIAYKKSKEFHYTYGIKAENIHVKHSANNGTFQLIGLPVSANYSTSNHFLNPTKGLRVSYILNPYANVIEKKSLFLKQELIGEFYLPTFKSERLVSAFRFFLGSIVGPTVYKIPMTKLFLGGSDEELRGYRYKTVSPRNKKGKIIGGRSAIYFTWEERLRLTSSIGLVPFFDVGNVQLNQLPTVHGKWRKAVGIGLRYFTFFGPLRFDVGFPLNKYQKSDPNYRIYVSIGQMF
jgi:translocation and assembly module TamA